MADRQVMKRAKYKSSVKDPGVPGVLNLKDLFSRRVIQNRLQRGQSKGANYIIEFDNFADRDVYRDFVATAIALHGEAGRLTSEKSGAPVSNEQLSTSEMELRIKLLQENG